LLDRGRRIPASVQEDCGDAELRGKIAIAGVLLLALLSAPTLAQSTEESIPSVREMSELVSRIQSESPETLATPIRIVLILTLLSIIPAVLVLTTSFTRIVIVLSFIKRALATRNVPPPQVVTGLGLFLTVFVMAPTFRQVNAVAVQPYMRGECSLPAAIELAVGPVREFMFMHASEDDLALFVGMSEMEAPDTRGDVPTHVLVPAFVVSELKTAFELGFVLFLPFLVLDLVVASVLLSMGMMMLPPMMISAPLKLLLFVLVDGWHLVTESLMLSFGGA
jgi:flagellar biosynthetic protein FliP